MHIFKRTNSADPDFEKLVKILDADLAIRDGAEHAFYAALNKSDSIKYVIVAYDSEKPVGIGALREYDTQRVEIKRMFTAEDERGKGIASKTLRVLEDWARELGYEKCILETGNKQPEAIALYKKSDYKIIPNYGKYASMENSVCFEKSL